MKKSILMSLALATLVIGFGANAFADDRIWGYEDWEDLSPADGQVDEWGRHQVDFLVTGTLAEPTGTTDITAGNVWGKVYYGTGVASSDATTTHRYLDIEVYDIQGGLKVEVSGAGDVDITNLRPFLVGQSGDPGSLTTINNPGRYVFDLSGWDDGAGHANTFVHLVAEGAAGDGFEVRRIFLTDENLLAPVPEASSWLMLGIGMVGVVGYMRTRLKK